MCRCCHDSAILPARIDLGQLTEIAHPGTVQNGMISPKIEATSNVRCKIVDRSCLDIIASDQPVPFGRIRRFHKAYTSTSFILFSSAVTQSTKARSSDRSR